PNPQHKTIDITAQAAGAANVQIRFHYFDANNEWYWMVDNVKVTYPAPPSCTIHSCDVVASPPPEVLNLNFTDPVSASWSSAAGATSYNLYRGSDFELPKLYTSDA